MPAGRPTDYSPELTAKICEKLALGDSLRKICEEEDMPAMSSVFLWLTKYPEFSEQYTRAREAQAEAHADRIVEIADNISITPDHKRIMVDARKWVASKLKPKRYGDKIDLEHKGEVGLTVNIKRFSDG
jgi:hypothetical protein